MGLFDEPLSSEIELRGAVLVCYMELLLVETFFHGILRRDCGYERGGIPPGVVAKIFHHQFDT